MLNTFLEFFSPMTLIVFAVLSNMLFTTQRNWFNTPSSEQIMLAFIVS